MTLGPGRRRHGIRRTGSLRILAETGHLNAAGSGAIGILEAPPPKQALQVPTKSTPSVKHGKGRKKTSSTYACGLVESTEKSGQQERQPQPNAEVHDFNQKTMQALESLAVVYSALRVRGPTRRMRTTVSPRCFRQPLERSTMLSRTLR